MAESILKNAVYDLQKGDDNEYFPRAIENAIVSWDRRTPVTFLYMDPARISWRAAGQDHSYVYALALMPDPSQEVLYEIKWDARGVPGGDHLGQIPGVAQTDFIIDKDEDGISITDLENSRIAYSCYFEYKGKNVFYFKDSICQDQLAGHWGFRVRIMEKSRSKNKVKASCAIDIDWGNRRYNNIEEEIDSDCCGCC